MTMTHKSRIQMRLDFQRWLHGQDYTTIPSHVAESNRLVDIGCYMSGTRAVQDATFD